MLIENLAQLPEISVPARHSVSAFKGMAIDPQAIRHTLGVSTILTGTVAQAGEQISISIQISDTQNGQPFWSKVYSGPSAKILTLQPQIIKDVIQELGLNLSPQEQKEIERTPTDDSLAQAHTSLALVNWLYDWDWPAADREFRRSIELNHITRRRRIGTGFTWQRWGGLTRPSLRPTGR